MLHHFVKHNKIDINKDLKSANNLRPLESANNLRPLESNHKGTTIEKIQRYLNNHWGLYKPNMYIDICKQSDIEFDAERFIDSWKTIQPGDFIEQFARKNYICRVKTNELFDLALTALNSKCLSIDLVDVEVLLYVLYVHVEYKLPFTTNTTNLLKTLLTNPYVDTNILTMCYVFMTLLPNEIIYDINQHIINKLSSPDVIKQFNNEPWTFHIFYRFIGMMYIPHSINAVVIKHVFKNSLYLYLSLFVKLPLKTILTLKQFCYKHYNKIVNNKRVWYMLSKFEENTD